MNFHIFFQNWNFQFWKKNISKSKHVPFSIGWIPFKSCGFNPSKISDEMKHIWKVCHAKILGYPVVNVYITDGKITIFNGNIHYIYMAIFNCYVSSPEGSQSRIPWVFHGCFTHVWWSKGWFWFSFGTLLRHLASFHHVASVTFTGWWCNGHLEKYESMGRMTSHIWNGK